MDFAETQYDVMISYKWKDSKDFAEELQRFLQGKNIRVYRDETENKVGQDIPERWKQAIRNCQVFLPILSKNYSDGTPEKEFFFNKYEARKPVVPVVMKGFEKRASYELDDRLYKRIPADIGGRKEAAAECFRDILDGVKQHLIGKCSMKYFYVRKHKCEA